MSANEFLDVIQTASGKRGGDYDTLATVVRIEDGTAWVHIDGGVTETPAEMTIAAAVGDTVRIRIAGGRCWVSGNLTEPPTGDKVAKEAKKEIAEINKHVYSDRDGLHIAINKNNRADVNGKSFDIVRDGKVVASFGEKTVIHGSDSKLTIDGGGLVVDNGFTTFLSAMPGDFLIPQGRVIIGNEAQTGSVYIGRLNVNSPDYGDGIGLFTKQPGCGLLVTNEDNRSNVRIRNGNLILDTSAMVDGLYGSISRTEIKSPSITVPANGTKDITFSVEKENYIPVGIVGWHGSGTNYGYCTMYNSYLSGNDLHCSFRSRSSASATFTYYFSILYVYSG